MGARGGTGVREGDMEVEGGRPLVLPVVGNEGGNGEPVGHPIQVEVSSLRLVATLAVAGALAGLVIVLVFQWAQPRIQAYEALVLRQSVVEVLGGPESYETVFLLDGAFTTTPPATADTAGLDRIYVGYDESGRPVGVAMAHAEPGFQDLINVIFGYHPGRDEVLGMKVMSHLETPGLGDKIVKDSLFVAEFAGVATPLQGIKPGRATGADNEVDMITGATISSQTVINIINHRLEALREPLGSWWETGPVAVASASGGQGGAP